MSSENIYILDKKNDLVNKIYERRGYSIDTYEYLYNIRIQILRTQNDRCYNSEFFFQ